MMAASRLRTCALLAAAALAACSGTGPVLEQLDERVGMALTRAAEPLVFARTDPRYSRSARDYLYIGPIETNRQGTREYYLWVGAATTIDRGFAAATMESPEALYVTLEGAPMELPLRPLAELVRRTTDAPVYPTAVPLQAQLAARVTLQQLELLDAAGFGSLGVAVGAAPLRTYVRWGNAAGFAGFVAAVRQ